MEIDDKYKNYGTLKRLEYVENQMKKAEQHEKLYHATKVESLISIIKNKELWLSNLNNVNDTQERKNIDFKEYRNSTYVACFSYSEELAPHHWEEYGGEADGVLIGIKNHEFWTSDIVFLNSQNGLVEGEDNIIFKNIDDGILKAKAFFINSMKLVEIDYLPSGYSKDRYHIAEIQEGGQYIIPALTAIQKDATGWSIKGKKRNWYLENEVRLVVVLQKKDTQNQLFYYPKIRVKLKDSFFKDVVIKFSPKMNQRKKYEYRKQLEDLLGKNNITFLE